MKDSNSAPIFIDAAKSKTDTFDFKIPENATSGDIMGQLTTYDPDLGASGSLTFTIETGNVGGLFHIDPKSGELSLAKTLNFEDRENYTLTVKVMDGSYR